MDFIKNYVHNSSLFGHKAWDDRFTTIVAAELKFYFLERRSMFNQTELIEGWDQVFPRSTNWALEMHVETRMDYKK